MAFDKWDDRFIKLTQDIAAWSSCIRRQMSAIIVRDKRILTTGYNGAPEGITPCVEKGECMRDKLGIPSGTQGQLCYAVHAEQNALAQAARMGVSVMGATIYITHSPCSICARQIINSGIKRIVYIHKYPDDFTDTLISESGILYEQYPMD